MDLTINEWFDLIMKDYDIDEFLSRDVSSFDPRDIDYESRFPSVSKPSVRTSSSITKQTSSSVAYPKKLIDSSKHFSPTEKRTSSFTTRSDKYVSKD